MGKGGVKTVLTIGSFFLGAGGWNPFGIAGGVGGIMGGMMGASLMGTIWSATHKPKYDYDNNSRFDQMMNSISSESAIPVIYGERKWAGNQLWHNASTDGLSLTKDVLVGEGECTSVSEMKFNDVFVSIEDLVSITGNGVVSKDSTDIRLGLLSMPYTSSTTLGTIVTWINQQLGWSAELLSTSGTIDNIANFSASAPLVIKSSKALPNCSYELHNGSADQAPPDNFDIVGGYRRMAWLRCKMKISSDLQGNNPTVSYVTKGIKVLDTRTNTFGYSDNPAMCTRDFLLSKRYGISKFVPGMVLDEQSFKEAADYCDQLVNYYDAKGVLRQEKRYTLNIILDQKRKAMEHLDSIFACFGGFLVNNNGVIALRIEKSETPSYHFTNDTIVENSVSIEQLSIDETPNQYKIGYFDTTQNWTQVKALVNDIVDQQPKPIGKGKVVTKELTLDGCTSQSQALRLGRLYRLKNKLCSLTASWKTSTFAMHLQCGDVVTMTYDKVDDNGTVFSVFVDKPWRIIEISEADGIWSIKAREYNESIYGDVTEAIEVKNYVPLQKIIVADTAVALANPQTINGVTFDGTKSIDVSTSLNDSGVTAGLYTKVTVNAKGIVTSGSNPTTLQDYGITDAYPKGNIDSLIKLRIQGTSLQASLDNGITWKTVTLT